jgi:hypothetical protein
MEAFLSWEPRSCSKSQEIHGIIWNTKIYFHKSPPQFLALNPDHILASYFFILNFNIIPLSTSRAFIFSGQNFVCHFHFSDTCYILRVLPDFMIPITFDEDVLAKNVRNPRSYVAFRNVRVCIAQPICWRTTIYRLPATNYCIFLNPPSVSSIGPLYPQTADVPCLSYTVLINRNNFEQFLESRFLFYRLRSATRRHNSLWHLLRFKVSDNCRVSGYTLPRLHLLTAWSNNCPVWTLSQAATVGKDVRISPQRFIVARPVTESGHVCRVLSIGSIPRRCGIHHACFQGTTEEN